MFSMYLQNIKKKRDMLNMQAIKTENQNGSIARKSMCSIKNKALEIFKRHLKNKST